MTAIDSYRIGRQPASRRLSGPQKELIYIDECSVLIDSDAHVLDIRELLNLYKEDLERRKSSLFPEIPDDE